MIEIAIVIPAKLAEYLVAPLALPLRLKYVMNYRSNLEKLEGAAEELTDRTERVRFAVDSARRQGEEVEMHIEKWLDRVEGVMFEVASTLELAYEQAEQRSWNLKKRYQLSRQAKLMWESICELLEVGKFDSVSYRATLRRRRAAPLTPRSSNLYAIKEAMRDANVEIAGVYGMGGSGKTTLVKKVAREAMEEKLFDVMIMVHVSSTPDIREIQGQIADGLGLKFHEETASGRASRLYARLKKEKKVLLILDDLWDFLDLEKVGIPFAYDHRGCKLLLTSRRLDVLRMMGAQHNFLVETLPSEEAFDLFRNRVGDSVELPEFQSLAAEVVNQCGGLPIAIVTIATALKNKDLSFWKNALRELERQRLASENFKGVAADVYSSIELCYNYLNNEELKFMFLLCGIMENDSVEDLLRYAMGLGLFTGIRTMEEAQNQVARLVQILKDSSLLLDNPNSERFCMHDVIRDVARSIASRDQHMFTVTDDFARWVLADNDRLKNCTAISLHDIRVLPDRFECPQLKFLYLKTNDPFLEVSDDFFIRLPELRVLHLIGMGLLSLPTSLGHLVNLRTLCMNQCKLRDIAVVGELKKLEILCFHSCDIEKLPGEIRQLTRLRLLDLSHCSKLRVIAPNVISCLTQLEEIYMENSSIQWEVEESNSARSNAGLTELKHLSCLTTLEICVQDAKLIPNDLFSEMLKRYKIIIGDDWGQGQRNETVRTLKLSAIDVERVWPEQLPVTSSFVKNLTSLVVHGCENLRYLFSSSMVYRFEQLQYLEICDCTVLEEIIIGEELREEERKALIFPKLSNLKINDLENLRVFSSGGYIKFSWLKELELQNCPELKAFIFNDKVEFPELEKLIISGMDNLKTIWDNQVAEGSFCKLRSLEVEDCQTLLTVFPSCICERLLMLQSLTVKSCGLVEQIFDLQELNFYEMHVEEATQLRELYIDHLPNLKHIWNGDTKGIHFFGKLQKVTVFLCPNLKNLFPASSARSLWELESLEVSDCGVEGVIARGTGVNEAAGRFRFPQLVSLQLHCLPELITLYPDHTVEVPHLRKLGLHHCDKVEVFISEYLYFYKANEEVQLGVSEQQPFLVGKDFHNLEELQLSGKNITTKWQGQVPEGFFGSLRSLELSEDKSAVLPLDMIQKFHRLEKLSLNNGSYQEIFSYGKIEEQGWMLSQIKHLILSELYHLEHIWKHDSYVQLNFEYLEILEVWSCINLTSLMPSSASFQNLTILEVWGCNRLINLVTSSTAKSLVQLEKLEVFDCKIMTEVIANEGAVTEKIIFRKLKSLSLVYLQNLSSFCSMKHTLKFPNLESLVVNECPKMNLFSEGVTSTPSLRKLELNSKVFEQSGEMDLNATIQQDVEKRLRGREDSSDPSK